MQLGAHIQFKYQYDKVILIAEYRYEPESRINENCRDWPTTSVESVTYIYIYRHIDPPEWATRTGNGSDIKTTLKMHPHHHGTGIPQSSPTISVASSTKHGGTTTTNSSTGTGSTNNSHNNRPKPLPLKQRTSSIDQRRDYTTQTWISVLNLVKLREYVITVDHFPIWRRHLAWAMDNGKDLRDYITQRYAASMVFMSLLLSTELGVLFNSAGVTTAIRQSLRQQAHHTVSFWAGIAIIISAIFTLLSLISTFTAWTMVSAISDVNAHCILRSSIGQYAAELPGRFIVGSIYSFLIWFCLFLFLLLPAGFYSYLLLIFVICLFVHTITAFSAFGRVIMHTGAMGSNRIFDKGYESSLQPHSLHANLLIKAKANLGNKTSIIRQYQMKSTPIARLYSEDEMSGHLSIRSTTEAFAGPPPPPPPPPLRERGDSFVKFADGFNTNGDRFVTAESPLVRETKDVGSTSNKSKIRNTSIDSTIPYTAPRRPPRQQYRPDHYHDDDKTPLVANQSASSSSQIVDRWIEGVSRNDANVTNMNIEETMLTKDKHGHTRRISFDNPYLLFEDPTPFVPSMQQDQSTDSVTRHQQPSPHPFYRSLKPTAEPTYSPSFSDNNNNTDPLQYDISSDDEALFNNDYGATDDDDDDDDDRDKGRATISKFAPQQARKSRLVTVDADNMKNHGVSITTPSEQTRLIDDHQLERGDYHATQY